MDRIKIEEVLEKEGIFICTTVGTSMYPMLRDRRDTVVIRPVSGRLKKYDIPLYRAGDKYVLHRIIKVLPGKGYFIRGDNCFLTEKNIPDDAVIGVLTEFIRNGKTFTVDSFGYKLYYRIWVFLHPAVCAAKRIRAATKKTMRILFKIDRRSDSE